MLSMSFIHIFSHQSSVLQ